MTSLLATLLAVSPPLWTADDTVVAAMRDDAGDEVADAAWASGAVSVLYLNFSDGTTVLTTGADDATRNQSQICATNAKGMPPYVGTEEGKRAHVLKLAETLADFNVVLTTTRPTEGVYSMDIIGPQGNGCMPGGGILGIAPIDCGNRNRANISFTFGGDYVTTAQEVAHAWGLEHVDVECDVMGAGYSRKGCKSGAWGYPDQEGALIGAPACGSPRQNSHARMLAALGTWPGGPKPDPFLGGGCVDATPPVATIVEPADGAVVPRKFRVRVAPSDDCSVDRVRVELQPADVAAERLSPPFEWEVDELEGAQTITVDVTDGTGKTARSAINVTVASEDAGGAGGDASADAGADAGVAAQPGGGGGCAMTGVPAALGWGALAALVAALATRLRPRRQAQHEQAGRR